jgi:5-formyltetrahydrofolate cyclo-ligase
MYRRSAVAAPSTAACRRSRITDQNLNQAKRALRAEMIAARAAHGLDGAAAARAVRDQFLAAIPLDRPNVIISGYWPIDDEFDPRPLLEALSAQGCECALPVVTAPRQPLDFRRWRPGDRLRKVSFGLSEPVAQAPHLEPTVVIAPMLAVDTTGRRLGYGGGFYDRTIDRLRQTGPILVAAIGYDFQVRPTVPAGEDDQMVDWVMTERRAIECYDNRQGQ